MKLDLSLGLLAISTLWSGAFAIPHKSNLLSRIQARSLHRQSHPLAPIPGGHPGEQIGFRTANEAAIAYSNNWAGVVRENAPPGGPYTAVSATFTIPQPTAAPGATGMQAGSAWVGIDGDTYSAAILQTGVDFYVQNGKTYNDAWFEWFPDYAYDININVSTGDVVVAKVEALSASEGVAVIENKSTGQTATQSVAAPKPTATLAGQNAEWIVEDFQSGDSMVALADFDEVRFTGCEARASNGDVLGLNGGTIIELKQAEKVLTQVTVQGDETLDVKCTL